ncbi:MAG: TorD/DmsD family molecular chaperone [Candidatus Anammoxibacter sp.]
MKLSNTQPSNSNPKSKIQEVEPQNPNSEEGYLSRSVIYKFYSFAYRYPDEANNECLQGLWEGMDSALFAFPSLLPLMQSLEFCFSNSSRDWIEDEYISLFGHSAQGNCPPFEIEYGEGGEDIRKPHELSDIAAFYRAAGLKHSDRSSDRVDFVAIELEFMSFLFSKQSYAAEKSEEALIKSCTTMQRKFLQDHLARWLPAFTRRIMQYSKDGFYGVLANMTLLFILQNCEELGVRLGSEKLSIRMPIEVPEGCMDCTVSEKESA